MPTVAVLDSTMAYLEQGSGVPLVFVHGNPTSSYLWRHVLPKIGQPGRCLAPDLIGMGESGKPHLEYRFADHARYLDAWMDTLALDHVVLIGHDWGGALAFDWSTRHPDRTRGIAFMETIMKPTTWDDFAPQARTMMEAIRTPGVSEQRVLNDNFYITQALPRGVPGLSADDLAAYGKPYPTPESRRPMLQWPREMPIQGEPADTVARIEAYDAWLAASSEVPKLLLAFEQGPGAPLLMGPPTVDWCVATIASLDVEHCGPAGHHAPEDQPAAIAAALTVWADRHRLRS